MDLKYNDGIVPQYNGNIANQVWTIQGQSQQTYTYKYDQLNRLTEGRSANYAERGISYDVMGNIGTLSRVYNNTLIDILSYNYLVSEWDLSVRSLHRYHKGGPCGSEGIVQ